MTYLHKFNKLSLDLFEAHKDAVYNYKAKCKRGLLYHYERAIYIKSLYRFSALTNQYNALLKLISGHVFNLDDIV